MHEKVVADRETISVMSNPALQQQARLDENAKRLLSLSPVLAVLLQKSVPELQHYSGEFIASAIKVRENIMVSPDFTVDSKLKITTNKNIESKLINEKTLFFDKVIDVELSEEESIAVNLIVDYEVQGTTALDYPLEYRGVYYLSRLISSQLNYVDEDTKDYYKLKKVYSIWICLGGMDEKEQNSVVSYSMSPTRILGSDFEIPSADLMQLIVVKLGNAAAGVHSELIRFLYGVFEYATHKEYFEEFVDTTIVEQNEALRKELNEMSGVGAALYASGVREGEARGEARGKIEILYKRLSLTPEEIAEEMHMTVDEVCAIIEEF